jgi:hemerythrin-like metal-binding protein
MFVFRRGRRQGFPFPVFSVKSVILGSAGFAAGARSGGRSMDDDELAFIDDDEGEGAALVPAGAPWVILVVDDDGEVHAVTRLALLNFSFMDRRAELLYAHSAAEAEIVLRQRPDIALILLDVVMEREDSGLRLARHVREALGNNAVRIILRTGQPGQAPEKQVITDYDINDYRAKTELTHDRLHACVIAALRSYHHISLLEANNIGMARIIDATTGMFRSHGIHRLLDLALNRLVEMMEGCGDAVFTAIQHGPTGAPADAATVLANATVLMGCGRFAGTAMRSLRDVVGDGAAVALERVIVSGEPDFGVARTVLPMTVAGRWSGAVLFPDPTPPDVGKRSAIKLFCVVMAAALENAYLLEDLRLSHKATVLALADLAENRDTDTGTHVLRVARLSADIARELRRGGVYADQIDSLFVESIGPASVLHDIGKVGLPDSILKKSGGLNDEERAIMEGHTLIGAQALERARRMVCAGRYLELGWDTTISHHEWFDGMGYPRKLKGQEIPLAGRIVAVADVFDALTSPRVYKPAWPVSEAMAHVESRSGTQFDPLVVQAFQAVMARWMAPVRIRWVPEMSVGHPDLDEDHRRLIDLINQLVTADAANDRSIIESVLDELIQYTDVHFAREENYLADIGFPQLDHHARQHGDMRRKVAAFHASFFNGLPGRLGTDIVEFLCSWLSQHILMEDRSYRLFAESTGRPANTRSTPAAPPPGVI